jgi:phosphatidylserine/phosphatidylglycerophosphate/cardiolipin synthase-like enzyme
MASKVPTAVAASPTRHHQAPDQRPRFTAIRLLPDNDIAWKAKRHLISHARRTLDLSYFILEVDGTTSCLMLDLIEAAQRGVQVRLMVDYFTTFLQAPALRTLGAVPNLQVRRYGVPTPVWLSALQAAGIDRDGFVKSLMAAHGPGLAQALQHNTVFKPAVTASAQALQPQAGESALNFPLQVLATLQASSNAAQAVTTAAGEREAALRKVALTIQILRGLKQFLHRNHHKLLLADGRRFIMGGRNLADAYQCAHPAAGHAFLDTDLLALDGRAGGSSHAQAFERLWHSAQAADISQPDPLDSRPPLALDALRQTASTLAPRRPGARFRAGVKLPDMDGELVDNLPSDKGDPSITQAYVEQIKRAVASERAVVVDIVSAYLFLVDDAADSPALFELRNSFLAAVAAGATVNIYTNSLASTDLKPVNRDAYPKLLALVEAGVRIFELDDGQGSLHTKAAAIGKQCLVVGSYNMDPRSELFDTNNLIVLHDASGAATAAFRRTRIDKLKWTALTVETVRQLIAGRAASGVARVTRVVL